QDKRRERGNPWQITQSGLHNSSVNYRQVALIYPPLRFARLGRRSPCCSNGERHSADSEQTPVSDSLQQKGICMRRCQEAAGLILLAPFLLLASGCAGGFTRHPEPIAIQPVATRFQADTKP